MHIINKLQTISKHTYLGFIFIGIIFLNMNYAIAKNYENAKDKPNKIEDPIQFLHSSIDQVLTELKKNHVTQKDLEKIVDNLIMPKVNFDEMSQWITGRAIWAKTNDKEKLEFMKQLKLLLIKTYASTLQSYSEEKIEFQNYTGNLNSSRIQIKSIIIRTDKENLTVDYRLLATADHSWKVYDLIIEGVSVLQGFRAQFSDDVRMHGINFVTNKIKEQVHKNDKN